VNAVVAFKLALVSWRGQSRVAAGAVVPVPRHGGDAV
jgi:hypothetical protein